MKRSNGEGSVYYNEKRKRYEGQLTYLDPLSHEVKRAFFTSVISAKDIKAKFKKLKAELAQGVTKINSKMTLKEWLDYWLEDYKKPEIRIKTYDRYQVAIKNHILPYLGKFNLKDLSTEQLQHHFVKLQQSGGAKGQGLAARTINTARRILIQSLNDAVYFGYLPFNPAPRTKPMRVSRAQINILTRDEALRLINAAKDYNAPTWMVVVLALGTGMREGEIFGLDWKHIDLEKRKLWVVQSAIKTNTGTLLQRDLKTKSSAREIPLPNFVVEALAEYKRLQQEYQALYSHSYSDQGFLVANRYGNIMHPATFSYHVFKDILLARAGIDRKFRFHDLRHTHATWLLEAGVNVKVVSERLGHANIRITLDTYAHVLNTMQGKAITELDRIYNEEPPKTIDVSSKTEKPAVSESSSDTKPFTPPTCKEVINLWPAAF